jgi:hypothetical protein
MYDMHDRHQQRNSRPAKPEARASLRPTTTLCLDRTMAHVMSSSDTDGSLSFALMIFAVLRVSHGSTSPGRDRIECDRDKEP